MEDKRTALAIFLCIVVVMVYTEVVVTPQARRAQQAARSQTAATTTTSTSPGGVTTTVSAAQGGSATTVNQSASPVNGIATIPTAAEMAASPTTTIVSSRVRAVITHLGGRLRSLQLLDYRIALNDPTPLDMVHGGPDEIFPLGIESGGATDARTSFTLEGVEGGDLDTSGVLRIPAGGRATLHLQGALSDGRTIRKSLTFADDSYVFSVVVAISGGPATAWLEWSHFAAHPENHSQYNQDQISVLPTEAKLKHVVLSEVPALSPESAESVAARWIAYNNQYFAAAVIPSATGPNARFGQVDHHFIVEGAAPAQQGEFTLYVGPKDYKTLGNLGSHLERLIDLGFFSFLAYPLLWVIRFFYEILGNYGLAIIGLTLLLKGLFLPLNQAQFRSMQAMQDVAPEMKALRERIKDPNQLNMEMMALYKRRGVNPMGGCLPMLIQIPVFFGLYSALMHSIEMRHSPFALWIDDLSSPENLTLFGIGVPVMVLIMGASMFVQQYLTPTASMDPAQKKVMMMMPVIFTVMFIVFPMPSGLVLYWLVSNVISIVQQTYMRQQRKASPAMATAVASLAIFALGYVLTLV